MPDKSIIRQNAERDPSYCPYCNRCPGLVRMVNVDRFLWRCYCGAMHDERTPMEEIPNELLRQALYAMEHMRRGGQLDHRAEAVETLRKLADLLENGSLPPAVYAEATADGYKTFKVKV